MVEAFFFYRSFNMLGKSPQEYATVQINKDIKQQIVDYCNAHNHKIGKFVEGLFTMFMSQSVLGGNATSTGVIFSSTANNIWNFASSGSIQTI